MFLAEHFFFLLIATPAFLAGAIADERMQGTLPYLLTADLTPWDIVAGKLLGRLSLVGLVSIAGWPLLGAIGGYGKLPLSAFGSLALLSILLLFLLGAVSLWASVRRRQTRDAALSVYLWFGVIPLFGWSFLHWGLPYVMPFVGSTTPRGKWILQTAEQLACLNPLHVLAPAWYVNDLAEFGRRLAILLPVYVGVGTLALGAAVWRLRPTMERDYAGSMIRRGRRRVALEVDDDPIRWKESLGGRRLWRWMGVVMSGGLAAAATWWVTTQQDGNSYWIPAPNEPLLFLAPGLATAFFLSLIAGIRASGSVSSERERKTWESVLITPLDTWDLVVDKQMGTVDFLFPFFVATTLPSISLALRSGRVAVLFTVVAAFLSWVSIRYMAATGVWCSVRAKTSWRSLITTFASGYAYLLGTLSLLAFFNFWLGCTLIPVVTLVMRMGGVSDPTMGLAITIVIMTALALGWMLIRRADRKISDAKAWIDGNERYGRTFVRSLARALRKESERRGAADTWEKPEAPLSNPDLEIVTAGEAGVPSAESPS